jgi:hypothetical protein
MVSTGFFREVVSIELISIYIRALEVVCNAYLLFNFARRTTSVQS